jgi:hypothetical protein
MGARDVNLNPKRESEIYVVSIFCFLGRADFDCCVVGLLVSGCSRTTQKPPPPPSVTVAPVERREVVESQEFTGRVEP